MLSKARMPGILKPNLLGFKEIFMMTGSIGQQMLTLRLFGYNFLKKRENNLIKSKHGNSSRNMMELLMDMGMSFSQSLTLKKRTILNQ